MVENMTEIIEKVIKSLKKCEISTERIESIEVSWEKIFTERAFPKITIKLYK